MFDHQQNFGLRISPTYLYTVSVSNNEIKSGNLKNNMYVQGNSEYCAAKISTSTQSKKVLKA